MTGQRLWGGMALRDLYGRHGEEGLVSGWRRIAHALVMVDGQVTWALEPEEWRTQLLVCWLQASEPVRVLMLELLDQGRTPLAAYQAATLACQDRV